MRTTIRVDEALLREAKGLAARTGRSLTAVIEDALRQSLEAAKRTGGEARAELPTFDGGGLQAGVDLDDTAALLEVMEGK
ncbi:MAG: ribbon-helix-helix protein, CopG family [Actinomycetota bacterium]